MNHEIDPLLARLVPRLADVPGVAGLALGGSCARGTATATSDYDIGLYFRSGTPLNTRRLLRAVQDLVDDPASVAVTEIGGWGPRIVGGGWLSIGGTKVDLLYREIDAVAAVIAACRAGQIAMDYQPGHPHGFCSAIWMGEVALCRPLQDPHGAIGELKAATSPYPDKLREALLRTFLWEVAFSIDVAATAVSRGEQTHVAGCAYRAFCCAGQVLFALNRRYLINEKGALAEAAGFPATIPDLDERVGRIWASIGQSDLSAALSGLKAVDAELRGLAAAAR